MQSTSLRVWFAIMIVGLLMKQASASALPLQNWKFLEHYATDSIAAASSANEKAILDIERQAQNDPSGEARAYVFLEKAILERMHFRLVSADHFAMQCMSAAKNAANDEAFAICGWLRMNLAAIDGDYKRVAIISGTIEAANHRLMRRAGLTDRDVEGNPYFFFLRGPSIYADLISREKPSIHRFAVGPDNIPFTYDKHALPLVKVRINGTTIDFLLDTGTGTTSIPSSLAAKLQLDVSRYKSWSTDAMGHDIINSEAFVKSFSVDTFTVDNFNIMVESGPHAIPTLGMDFLLRVGRFTIGQNKMTLQPEVDSRCHAPAIFRFDPFYNSIFPYPPRMGIETWSNYGHIYGLLDTGAGEYAAADWRDRKYFGINPKRDISWHIESIYTDGTDNALTAYTSVAFNLKIRGMTFEKHLHLYTNLNLPLHLDLGFKTTRDFSYYFDAVNGFACMRPIRGPAS